MQDMGAKSQAHEGFTFSSCRKSREWLDKHCWRTTGTFVTVVKDTRVLGAHLCTRILRRNGKTPTNRMTKATRATARMAKFGAPYSKKRQNIRGKNLPMGLYGCESAPVNENSMQSFRAGIANALTYALYPPRPVRPCNLHCIRPCKPHR